MKNVLRLFYGLLIAVSFAACKQQVEDSELDWSALFGGSRGPGNNNSIQGCSEPLASNYKDEAEEEDGSCIFKICGDENNSAYRDDIQIEQRYNHYKNDYPNARLEEDPELCNDDTVEPPPEPPRPPEPPEEEGPEGCDGLSGSYCQGGYDYDTDPKSLKVKVVYINPAGSRLTNNPDQHAQGFISSANQNYQYMGHRHMNIVFDQAVEVTRNSNEALNYVNTHAENGQYTIFIVSTFQGMTLGGGGIPSGAGGFVRHSCARLENKEGWTFMRMNLVNSGVIEHEMNHSFCFPHTTTRNGSRNNFYPGGCRDMDNFLQQAGNYKRIIDTNFKIYVHPHSSSQSNFVTRECHQMPYNTRNLMYFSVLPDSPQLFTPDSEGFHYTYSHLLDYYYWKFIKPHAQ